LSSLWIAISGVKVEYLTHNLLFTNFVANSCGPLDCREIQTAISSLEKQNLIKLEEMKLPKTIVSDRTANTDNENTASDKRTFPLNMNWLKEN